MKNNLEFTTTIFIDFDAIYKLENRQELIESYTFSGWENDMVHFSKRFKYCNVEFKKGFQVWMGELDLIVESVIYDFDHLIKRVYLIENKLN